MDNDVFLYNFEREHIKKANRRSSFGFAWSDLEVGNIMIMRDFDI